MKIKDILRGLLSGEDFSDHVMTMEDGNGPGHPRDSDCEFCHAWRRALTILRSDSLYREFDAGEKVTLPGGIRGWVVGTEQVIRVEVQNSDHGPWAVGAVGAFRPNDLAPRADFEPKPEFTYWAEKGGEGDVWERRESDHLMRVVKMLGGSTKSLGWDDCRWHFAQVERRYGLLTQVAKP